MASVTTSPLVPAELGFTREGVPFSPLFDDVYHSAGGALAQARHVFIEGNALPSRWAGRERFVIFETGFGAGINFLATWQAWRADPARCTRLHFVSVEKHPLRLADARAIYRELPELRAQCAELEARWPLLVPGAQRIELDGGRVVLTLFLADIRIARDLRLAADAFYLDGFAPAKNADMWSPQLMRALARLAAPGATAATWSVAAGVRHALEETGFAVEKRPGFGAKREMLVARYGGPARSFSVPKKRQALVVGAGLAGAAICERLCARGWEVTLFERRAAPALEASGNHAGVYHPIVTPDDSLFARVTRAGFLSALQCFGNFPRLRWDPCGALQLARDEKEAASQRRSIAALAPPADYAVLVTREEASAHAGVAVSAGGFWFPRGGWVQPASLVREQLAACGERLQPRFGDELRSVPPDRIVVLANSAEALRLHPMLHLRLRRVRGQISYVPAGEVQAPHAAVLRGGMVLPPVDGVCVVGATYDFDDDDPAPRTEGHAANLERAAQIVSGFSCNSKDMEGRVGFRAVTADRLPVVGRLEGNVFGAFAYGSRGLVWATLAAELIAAQLEGEPLPVEGTLADALRPARFAERAARRAGARKGVSG